MLDFVVCKDKTDLNFCYDELTELKHCTAIKDKGLSNYYLGNAYGNDFGKAEAIGLSREFEKNGLVR